MTTALTLINKVLRELRERVVTDFTADYTQFVLQKLNLAKEKVENVRPWVALRKVLTFNTASGTETYNLGTGTAAVGGVTTERSYLVKDEAQLPMVYDTTNKTQLMEYPAELLRGDSILALLTNTIPARFALIQSPTGYTLRIYPKPNGIYAMSTTWVIPQEDLALTGDVLLVPSTPVWLFAAAMCAAERGEGMGDRAQTLEADAYQALNDAIQFGTDINELTAYVD